MAVKLSSLYNEIYTEHDVRLLTNSCFDKKIGWVHMVENIDFVNLLHGDELVFNSTLNDEPEITRQEYIERLISVEAGGLIVALQDGHEFSTELIHYCNKMNFPLFQATWETSYLNIMRRFSEILLDHERNETNLIAAFKNAIYYPADEQLYLPHFERNGFSRNMPYIVVVLAFSGIDAASYSEKLALVAKAIPHIINQNIIYESKGKLILLTTGYSPAFLKQQLATLCQRYNSLHVGIGTLETSLSNIHRSYDNAWTVYQLSKAAISQDILYFDEIGIYQVLANIKEPDIVYPAFVKQTLGKLMVYDEEHHSNYMEILSLYFKNNCSITQTANVTFYHQNTLKYKIKAIKEILGYDITTNENRVKIIISLSILELGTDFFDEH